MDHLSDEIDAARGGDHEAFAALVDATHSGVFTLAFRLTGNEHDAADVVQEAYLRAYRGLGKFREDAQFTTWLYRITSNCASSHMGRGAKHRHEDLEGDAVLDLRHEHHPELAVDNEALGDELREALEQLPVTLRSVVVLRDVYDLTHADISEHLDISVTAAKVRLHRGRAKLRAVIEAAGQLDGQQADELAEELADAV